MPKTQNCLSECCKKVSVEYVQKNSAYDKHPSAYTTYVMDGTYKANGYDWYASADGSIEISKRDGIWRIHTAPDYKYA